MGYPGILYSHFPQAVRDVKQFPEAFSHLFVVFDTAGGTMEEATASAEETMTSALEREGLSLPTSTEVCLITQRPCIEGWYLASSVPATISGDFKKFLDHYDVRRFDPESIRKPDNFASTVEQYTKRYWKQLKRLRREQGVTGGTSTIEFLDELRGRVGRTPDHLSTFQEMLRALARVNPTSQTTP